ncbi:type I polyketide synthase [Allokutzneria albata]|uniref:Acyl transferase domain-containing protein n=1 Tax=Allokutzneria albata TaxID=211114 RepID=A0A1G9S0M1_ALLAB|nr:type I polyketide synthase [Allokutzneria albata]SDM29049.1 Acyl transferase domain-containing protein [Allokutzneria albata]
MGLTAVAVEEWIIARVAELCGADVGPNDPFTRHGMDSRGLTGLTAELGELLGRRLSATLVWTYPTPRELAQHLAGPAIVPADQPVSRIGEPIAIVGLACRLPGGASPEEFWRLLSEGRDAVVDAPAARGMTGRGGFLDRIDEFDAAFFDISPREAAHVDPQQRLALELAWEALENAGIPPRGLAGGRTGVFVGAMWGEYSAPPDQLGQHSLAGTDPSVIPARISYALGLRGPSLQVNTACSSSLVAVHLATQSLREGDCDLALVGGVSLMLDPTTGLALRELGALAPDGRSKAFDARADGYGRGEGGGFVVLKRMSEAAGDRVLAVIRGSAVNNDGASNGLTAPNPLAQQEVLRSAYQRAGISPADVQYVEAHGTGTELGDPIEASALNAVLCVDRPAVRPLRIGSVKSSIGHLEAAAGIAGLIKVVLAMRHRALPPSLAFEEPNPHIPFEEWRLRVQQDLTEWTDERLIAGVSAFGFGGTNCHVVLEGGQEREQPPVVSKAVFVFGGQGSQWPGMASDLLRDEPVFRRAFERCDAVIAPRIGRSLTTLTDDDWLTDTAIAQPAIFAMQVALVELLRSRGVEPVAVTGSSMGEVAAAWTAGALDLETAAMLMCERSRIASGLSGSGAMAALEMPEADVADLVRDKEDVWIAGVAGPRSTVISGEPAAVRQAMDAAARSGLIRVDYASHSPCVEPILPSLRAALAGVRPGPCRIPFYSAVTGGELPGEALDAEHWVRTERDPWRLSAALEALLADGHTAFVDVNPHAVLLEPLEQVVGSSGTVLAALRRGAAVPAEDPLAGPSTSSAPRQKLLVLSARTEEALRQAASAMAEWLPANKNSALNDVCHTLSARRSQHEFRLSVVGDTHTAMADALRAAEFSRAWADNAVFVFSGQGTQWSGMGRALLEREPVFRAAVESCDELFAPMAGWSLVEAMAAEPAETDVVQPLLFAIQVGLIELLRAHGISPAAVIGHSVGEVAAAYAAGALRLEDAVRVVYHRGRLMRRTAGLGRMASVAMSEEAARELPAVRAGRLDIAAVNDPNSVVLAGDVTGLGGRELRVDYAFHSRHMDSILDELSEALSDLSPQVPTIPIYSTGDRFDAGHWVRNVRDTVRFADHMSEAVAAGHRLFVEIGPHPALVDNIEECVAAGGQSGRAVGVLRRGEENVLRALGELYRHGLDVSFVDGSLIDLPGYPWQRERYWHSGGHTRDNRLHTLEWRRREHHEPVTAIAGTWLVLRDDFGIGAAVAERLRSYGAECVHSVEALTVPPAGVVWPYGAQLDVEELRAWRDLPRVWLVTHDHRQASLWGLGKSLALRHPEFEWTRVEVEDVDLLMRELAAGSDETDVLLRTDGRYVARVVRAADAVGRDGGLPFREDGTYLVINASVEVPRGHVIGSYEGERLNGIVYGGGDADLAWRLHELSLEHDLDFFVLLSSGASLLGDGPDAEVGAVFDAVAQHRRALGLPAFSIGGDHRVLSGILPSAPPQLTVVDLDVRQWLEAHPAAAGTPLLSELPRDAVRGPSLDLRTVAPERRRTLLEEHLVDQLARTLHQDPSTVDTSVPFRSLGLESLMAVELRNRLENSIGVRLSVALLFTYSTVSELAEHLLAELEPGPGEVVPEQRREEATEPIAIIGMGLRVPGGADDPESFWRLLEDRVDAVTEVPEHRWPRSEGPAGWGGFLSEVDGFDAAFFGISPREAKSLDPQQRLLLEVTWEALERAGTPPEGLIGSSTGVFVGMVVNDYDKLNSERDIYTVTGNGHSFPAGRLSYQLGAQGPSMTVDTACSSSLVAIHLACQSLRTGESTLALAGGVNLMLDPDMSDMLAGSNALSPDGRCRTFDSRANGYVRGEGCGMLVLKRLSDAEADGDPVLAVIRGSAVNSDGRSSGLTAPNVIAQKAVLREALRNAGAEASEVSYVETHGTGTPLGDPIEVTALADVLDGDRCVLGAVKTNIGHLEAAAGVVGVIKTVLVMRRQRIPANLHMRTLNPRIDLTGTPLEIASEPVEWQPGKLAGVSSFGISGTNAHVILAEPPPVPESVSLSEGPVLLPISARTEPALRTLASSYADFASGSLEDMAYTAAFRRHHHAHRAVFVADSVQDLAAKAGAFARGEAPAGVVSGRASGRPKVVFVFPGQGSQWVGMGRDLYATQPVFAEALRRCDEAVRAETGWSVIDVLHSEASLDRVEVIQPVLFAMGVALAGLWREHGIQPDVVVGHSMGEVAAAHVAGALSLADAVKVICRRSHLLELISGQGVMALVELSFSETEAALSTVSDQVSVAAVNGPRSTIISGTPAAVDQVLLKLADAGVFCRRVRVDVASHSPQVDPLTADLLLALEDIVPGPGTVPIHSTVSGNVTDGSDMDAKYWVRNLRAPVLFGPVVGELLNDGSTVFVEVSPHPVLLPSVDEVLTEGSATVASLRRDRPVFLEAVGAMHVHGVPVRWHQEGRCVALPTHPWQRERYWADPVPVARRTGGHPLLGEGMELATQPGVRVFSGRLDAPYLADHRVRGRAVLPGAASVEMALHATRARTVVGIDFERLVDEQPDVQLVLTGEAFELFSRSEAGWQRFASGEIGDSGEPVQASLPRLRGEVSVVDHYREQSEKGVEYGPAFQGIKRLWIDGDEAVAEIAADVGGGHVFHPALLDACFQVFGALTGGPVALVPVGVERVSLYRQPPNQLWVHARTSGDLVVFDQEERVIAEITGLRARELPARKPYEDWLYEISWRRAEPPRATEPTGKWLVLADHGGVGAQLAERLPDAVVAYASDGLVDDADWDRLLDSVPDCTGIVHMWALDAFEMTTVDSLAADQWMTTLSALRLVRAVLRRGLRDTPRLWFVTKGALSTSPLSGFGRTLDMEHPEFRSVRVELNGSAEDLLPELLAPDGENEIVLGPSGRHVARLTRRAAGTPGEVDWSGTYLITGGLGGLGIGLAEWMAERGARHIVLLGRTARSPEAVEALRARGVEVVVAQADVTQRADVARVLADMDRRMPPLKGIVHAAMVLDDRTVLDLDDERFERVLAPKVLGAWNLHELTANHDLDFFVLYSSASTILGSPGQANYAAANAFLGALARHRVALGKPALCVDWGLFAEAGIMADRTAEGSRLADRGVGALTPEQGTEILGALLGSDVTQIAALRLNLRQWLEFFPGAATNPLFAELRDREEPVEAVEVDADTVEPLVLDQLGRILHLDPARIDRTMPFTSMGVDSLMALELRNRLEAALGVRLSVTVLFAAPTVAALSEYLIDKLGLARASSDEYADVSTDDLLALLEESLDRVEGGNE